MAESESSDKKKPEEVKAKKGVSREDELSQKDEYAEALTKIATAVDEAYRGQIERTNNASDHWDIYECCLNDNQAYSGNAQVYVPIVRDAIDARSTRFTGQLFPVSGRYVEVITENGDIPHAEMALIEHYINKANLRTEVVPALCKNGDVEGQYNVYASWSQTERHVVSKKSEEKNGVSVDAVVEEIIVDEGPMVECLPDADIVISPANADSIEKALMVGGFVSIIRRWTQSKIDALIDEGEIDEDMGEHLVADMKAAQMIAKDIPKEHIAAAGIRAKGKWYLAHETWHMLKVNDEMRICRSYFGASDKQKLGTKLNPYWCDKVPIFSAAVKKMSGSMKGASLVKPVAQLQYVANDFMNQAADSATYSLMPIVMTDPNKNPKTSSMILDLAAVWEVDPNSTQFAKFPTLWKDGLEIVSAIKNQIFQSLSVNPSMIPSTGKSKRTQADIANEQAVDILTTADAVTVIENGILSPLLEFFVAMDMQYRHDEMLVPMFGMMGKRAIMDRIPPLQQGNRYRYNWMGAQAARNAAQIQQQAAGLNVIKGIPPNMYRDHRLDLTAFIEGFVENLMGPRLAPLTFVSIKDEMSIPQDQENEFLSQGLDVPVSPFDNDQEHMQKLQPLLQDPSLSPQAKQMAQVHFQRHQQSLQMKAQAQQMQAAQQMGLGQEGGPREGAQPGQGRPMQGPPGQIHKDQMARAGAVTMPRKSA